jgi:hypothetical protein
MNHEPLMDTEVRTSLFLSSSTVITELLMPGANSHSINANTTNHSSGIFNLVQENIIVLLLWQNVQG